MLHQPKKNKPGAYMVKRWIGATCIPIFNNKRRYRPLFISAQAWRDLVALDTGEIKLNRMMMYIMTKDEESLHPLVKVDQAFRPGTEATYDFIRLTLKLLSFRCTVICVIEII